MTTLLIFKVGKQYGKEPRLAQVAQAGVDAMDRLCPFRSHH
jgi:hypothetical protein